MTEEKKEIEEEKKETVMQCIVQTDYGEYQSVLKKTTLPVPNPTGTQVLIKVHNTALNPVDYKITMGKLQTVLGMKHPFVIGRDFSGVISELGPKITERNNKEAFKIGDRVAGMVMPTDLNHGSFAEYLITDIKNIVHIPQNMSFREACALPLVAQTSYQSLFEKSNLKKGDKVLILGGSTATGLIGIQLCKIAEASEIAVTSTQSDLCTYDHYSLCLFNYNLFDVDLGATRVINYKDQKWWEELKGQKFDIIYDTVGGQQSWEKAGDILKEKGIFTTIVGDAAANKATYSSVIGTGLSLVNRKFWSVCGYMDYNLLIKLHSNKGLREIFTWFAEGKISVLVDESSPYEFSEEGAKAMYAKQISQSCHGKLTTTLK
ncbi:hypothetical protein RFI_24138 [Reticulomyxa filosa]|uniref:Enoyl reductase (ER) domain-containing protein n=1 Tax=Reticulomyxa filosa TaxID=46433 RepID=X6MGU3_RETFI|nr:hypothetical protein RFI_24138 [Reticulomyxa filosa]|eukprot:ETO13238.1 hypothetical protein RFI_24138 [Reticulomyxa filosa]